MHLEAEEGAEVSLKRSDAQRRKAAVAAEQRWPGSAWMTIVIRWPGSALGQHDHQRRWMTIAIRGSG